MRKPISSLMVLLSLAVPLVGGIAAIAYAADLCLTFDSVSYVIQNAGGGKDGKDINKDLGKPNKCQQLSGFTTGPGFFGVPMFGTVSLCTDSTATHTTAVANFLGGSFQTQFPLPIPTTAGLTDLITSSGTGFGIPTTAAVCSPPSVPVP
jgi:hypothetical protein